MNIEELASILRNNYTNADKGNKVSAIHAFGVQYANEIKENNYSATEIIKKSGLNESYSTELSKGIKLYDYMKNMSTDVENDTEHELLSKLPWCEIAAIAMYKNDKNYKYTPTEVKNLPLVVLAKKIKKAESPSIGTELRECSNDMTTDYHRKTRNLFIRENDLYYLSENGIKYVEENFSYMISDDIDMPLNQILYGPPGTGKTYFSGKIKNQIMEYNKKVFAKKQSVKENIMDLSWSEIIALGMYKANKTNSYKPNELYKLEYIKEYIDDKKENGGATPECSLRSDLMRNSIKCDALSESGKTGNDYFEYEISKKAYKLSQNGIDMVENALSKYINPSDKKEINEDDFCKFITFHQSYSYEDFIIGIRPDTDYDGGLKFKEKRGIFKIICDDALNNPDYKYLITIDEINRGNISKIFGELITLIEANKRWGNEEQQKLTLPTGGTLCVPNNLYIVGTMNTADKSLALLDVALRRRFEFVPKYPVYDIDGIYYVDFLKKLNETILLKKKKADYLIGHAYFMDKKKQPKLKDILNKKVIPLLMEYFNGDKDCVAEILKAADANIVFKDTFHLEVI